MFCPYCGTKVDDGTRFCPSCGSNLDDAIPKQAQPSQPGAGPYKTMSSLTLTEVKKLAKSPLLLAAVICFTLGILLSFTRNPVREFLSVFETMFADELGHDYYDMIDEIEVLTDGAGLVSNIIGNLPAILYAVGMWMVVGSAFDKAKMKLSTGGLTLIKVLVIISFIATILIIAAVAATVFVLTMAIAEEYHVFSGAGMVMGILFFAAAVVLCVFYYVKLIKTINNIRYTANNGSPVADISGLVIFFCYLGGICGIAVSLFNFTALLNAASCLLFGVFLSGYRKKMQFLIANGRKYISPER